MLPFNVTFKWNLAGSSTAREQYLPVVLSSLLNKEVQSFESVDEILRSVIAHSK